MKKVFVILSALLLTLSLCGCTQLGEFLIHVGTAIEAGAGETTAAVPETEETTETEAASTTEAVTTETTAAVTAAAPDNGEPAQTTEAADEEWHYTVQVVRTEHKYKADDGTVIATKSYEQPVLRLENESGEIFGGSKPERGVTAEQLAACRAFEAETASTGLWARDVEEAGREIYEARGNADGGMPKIFNEVRVSSINQTGSLLSVLATDYIYLGGVHPDYGLHSWNFDLRKGEFVDLESLTDLPDDLKEAFAFEIAMQAENSEFADGLSGDWFDRILNKETFEVHFDEDSITVWFQEYELGPLALGVPVFEVPYGILSRYLNDYGEQLLDLPAEARVIGVFLEAQDLWTWLESGAPKDYNDEKTEGEIQYHRISDPNIHSLADLSAMLSQYIEKSYVDEQLAKNQVLREFDGALYAAAVGRGADMTIAWVDYAAEIDGESGKVIVTIHRRDYDDESGKWLLTGDSDVLEFPFKLQDGRPVFSTMSLIY